MIKSLALSLLLLSGCSTEYHPVRDVVFLKVELVDSINDDPKILGYSTCANGLCQIQIRRDAYPACITHEVRHAFEGAWHTGPSDESCYE